MNRQDKETLIAEEAFVVLHSGEIPEVTFHEALYHLREDAEGPCLQLNSDDVLPLKQAVVNCYRAIILRDLDPENHDKSIYRGLARCIANWLRMTKFCTREKMDFSAIKTETAEALQCFLQQETADVQSKKRSSCINCCQAEIEELGMSLGLVVEDLPEGWRVLCPAE